MNNSKILLVDENNQHVGTGDKMEVHTKGILHRAFSIFVVNSNNDLLIQKRASHKYHSPDLWTNTCCSHAIANESLEQTLVKRLKHEMGFKCRLDWIFDYRYEVKFSQELFENEYVHAYIGNYESNPEPSLDEVSDWKWINIQDLTTDIMKSPEKYTYWFKHCFDQFYDYITRHDSNRTI